MSETEPKIYPEHKKITAIHDESQAIGDFLTWCLEEGIHLYSDQRVYEIFGFNTKMMPHNESFENLLARYFSIDLNVINTEKDEMLADMRRMNGIDP